MHHISAEPVQLAHRMGWPARHEASADDILLAAREIGLKAKLSRAAPERLSLASLPAIALVRDDVGISRTVVLAQCDGKRVLFQDPAGEIQGGRPVIESLDAFAARWSGDLILVASRAGVSGELARFDFSWFVPSLVKYRRLFGEVLVVSLFLQLFALISPLFFQVVMDKVLVHRGLTTLDVLVVGLAVIVVFESLLTILRTFVFSHTTSRIDVELGARLFRHLLNLPLAYFQARRVGDSVARVRELENIRTFLTGNAMTLLLDVAFSVIFVAVMFLYSVPLTSIVLVTLPLYFALSLAIVPTLRARLNEKFARGAESQALLVETVTGIQTVKASALEPAIARRWDGQLAAYIVDDPGDVINEFSSILTSIGWVLNTSVDTVYSSANSFTLPSVTENLVLTGTGGIAGTGTMFANTIVGNSGANSLNGGGGNDTLDGGAGNDWLDGGTGNDTYYVGRGSGADTIWAYELNSSKIDVLQLGTGIATSDVQLRQQGNDLIVNIVGTSDSVRVMSHFMSGTRSGYQIDQLRFADGTTWNVAAIQAHLSGIGPASVRGAEDALVPEIANRAIAVEESLPSDDSSVDAMLAASAFRSSLSMHKQILLNDDSVLSSWFDGGPRSISLPTAPASAAEHQSRVRGLIDAMATFSASAGDSTFMPTSHQFTVMPIVASQYPA